MSIVSCEFQVDMRVLYEYRQEVKRSAYGAKTRKALADEYRACRWENPAMARLLWRRMREAVAAANKIIWDKMMSGGDDLFKEHEP